MTDGMPDFGSLDTFPKLLRENVCVRADTLQSLSNLKGEVDLTKPGGLANDGLVIEDKRPVD